LIKPIQRICKYPLFFRDIIDATKVEEPLYVVLSEVSTLIQEIVSHINNNTALRENFTKIMFYRDAIVDYKKELYVPNRILVRDGKLNKASGKIGKTVTISSALERQCILFDDVFVYCKIVNTTRFQFKGELEFTKVNLIDTNDNHPNHDVAFCIENPDTNKTYWLFFSTPKEKIDWFNDIKKCIEKKTNKTISTHSQTNQLRTYNEIKNSKDDIKEVDETTIRLMSNDQLVAFTLNLFEKRKIVQANYNKYKKKSITN